MKLTRKFGYVCDIQHFKLITGIMADNSKIGHNISRHSVQFLQHILIMCIYTNITQLLFLFDNASYVI